MLGARKRAHIILKMCPQRAHFPTGTPPNWHVPHLAHPQLAYTSTGSFFKLFFFDIDSLSPPNAGIPSEVILFNMSNIPWEIHNLINKIINDLQTYLGMCLELDPMDLMDEWKKVTSVVVREWQARKNLTDEEKQEEKGYQDYSLKFCPKKNLKI